MTYDHYETPFPPLEQGDFVSLNEPYKPATMMLNGPLRATFQALVANRHHNRHTYEDEFDHPTLEQAYRNEAFEDLFEFTHGTVVEVISRYSASRAATNRQEARQWADHGEGPPENVSLHLFNPQTGLLNVGGHPTEPGKPEFVDFHAANLTLIQKHDETWGTNQPLDYAEVYDTFGITGIGTPAAEGGE